MGQDFSKGKKTRDFSYFNRSRLFYGANENECLNGLVDLKVFDYLKKKNYFIL